MMKRLVDDKLKERGKSIKRFDKEISLFSNKLDFLDNLLFPDKSGRYSSLIKSFKRFNIKAKNGLDQLEEIAFEVHFAYAFEKENKQLKSDVKLLDGNNTDIDYQYSRNDFVINFELVHSSERDWIKEEQKKQSWEIHSEEIGHLVRIQSQIRGKCGKFNIPDSNQINIIVIDVSEPLFGSIDVDVCMEIINGSKSIPQRKHGLFGLADELPPHNVFKKREKYEQFKSYYKQNKFFRERINAVMFMKDRNSSKKFLNPDYEYFVVGNPLLIDNPVGKKIINLIPKIFKPMS